MVVCGILFKDTDICFSEGYYLHLSLTPHFDVRISGDGDAMGGNFTTEETITG